MSVLIERRLVPSRTARYWVPVLSLVLALLAGSILLAAAGANPWITYKAMFIGAFGGEYAFSETLVKAIPLMLCGLGVSVATVVVSSGSVAGCDQKSRQQKIE